MNVYANNKRLLWIGLGVRLLLSAFTRHGWDFRVIHQFLAKVWSLGGLEHTYTEGLTYFPDVGQMWFYGSVGTALASWPSYFLRDFSAWNPLHVLAGHLPYLLAEICLLVVALRLLPRHMANRFVRLYWLSPFWLYLNYCYGQIDILGASLSLIGTLVLWWALVEGERRLAATVGWALVGGLIAGLSFHVKIGCLAGAGAAVLVGLYSWHGPRRKYAVAGVLAYGAGFLTMASLVMMWSLRHFPNYFSAIVGGPTGRLTGPSPLGPPSSYLIPAASAVLLGIYLYLRRPWRERGTAFETVTSAVLISVVGGFYVGICFNPHWIMWSLPVWMTALCLRPDDRGTRALYRIVLGHTVFILIAYDSFTSFRTFEMVLAPTPFPLEATINYWNQTLVPQLSKLTKAGFTTSLVATALWAVYCVQSEKTRRIS